ncbi:hypothetical protein APT_01889 [Acetobacter pasteurianus NBRC 101655]|uniref:hypothetical protein n=1 Tax=Acetobacter pasteurianus TaxID=438 RepID=UPI00024582C2|nr:hypothetical protein [Acetobacter pasteurianus]BAU38971.1 hypothetical protein APT_01889 [Acetobacter pasteurianus NBRC 101655]
MQRLNGLNETLRNEGIIAALAQVDAYDTELLDFSQEEPNHSMNTLIHDVIANCNDENFLDVFVFLNKIGGVFGVNVSLSLEILSFNLRRNIDLNYQVKFFESIPKFVKDFSDVQMLGAESYRRLGNIDKALSIFSSLPCKEGWWPYDDIWQSLSYGLGCYLLQKNVLFLERQKPYKWSFRSSVPQQYMVSDLVSGLLNPWRHDPMTFKMDIEHLIKDCRIPEVNVKSQILDFLTNHIADLDTDRASIVFQLAASCNSTKFVEKILENKDFVFKNLAISPSFVFSLDLFQQQFSQFADMFSEILEVFLQSNVIQRFMKGDWMAFESSHLPNTRGLAFEILSRYHNQREDVCVEYIPFVRKATENTKEIAKNSKKHLFVGLYGVTANLDSSLKAIFDYLKKDTQTWRDEGHLVSIGISTFKDTSPQFITAEQKCENIIDFMPEKLERILQKFNCSNLAELQAFLPHTIQLINGKSQNELSVHEDHIKNICSEYELSENVYFNIFSDKAFWQDTGEEFLQYFGNNDSLVMDDIKTCYCLSGLHKAADAAEISQNIDIDRMILLNLNSEVVEGSLTHLCNQTVNKGGQNKILSAKLKEKNISEKEGDTYFVGGKNSVSKLFYTDTFIKNIITSYVFGYVYRDKFISQEIIQTVLYENGCNVEFSSEVEIQKIRVNIPWPELREALIKDSFGLKNEDLLRFIRNETKN